jgi:hypothetical protein
MVLRRNSYGVKGVMVMVLQSDGFNTLAVHGCTHTRGIKEYHAFGELCDEILFLVQVLSKEYNYHSGSTCFSFAPH